MENQFIDRLLTDNELINNVLKKHLPFALEEVTDTERLKKIEIDIESGEGSSKKIENIKLNIPLFIKIVCETIVDGVSAYEIPALIFPAFIKLVINTNELVSIKLTKIQTCILIALHKLTIANNSTTTNFDKLLIETKKVLSTQNEKSTIKKNIYFSALKQLDMMKCIQIDEHSKSVVIKETINLVI